MRRMPSPTHCTVLDSFTTFGELLCYLRRRAGLTQTEFAAAVGYSHAQISRLEHNHRPPDLATVVARFVPTLGLGEEPAVMTRFLQLAGADPTRPAAGSSQLQPRHNLPYPLTSFIGREQEIAKVRRSLLAGRLVTLTGSGGSGKTRLAIQVATQLVGVFSDGVWLVELARLTEPGLVPNRVASVLGVREVPGQTLSETLVTYVRAKQILIVLDNCEHLVQACAHLAGMLLSACRHVQVMATSRETLGITGEVVWQVPGLSLPDAREAPPTQPLGQFEAIQLFVERARAVKQGFAVTAKSAPAMLEVCQRLDGLPLAIELAAVHVSSLTLEQIAARLAARDRFNFLSTGSRTAEPRHQSLRAIIDWSYDLLDPKAQAALCRLAVFAGGFTLEAATAICAGSGIETTEVLTVLERLVNRSLVVVDSHPSRVEARYRLLETIREYGLDRLQETPAAEWAPARHARFFLRLAETAEPWLLSADRGVWMEGLQAEQDNVRAALEWTATEPARAKTMLRLAGALTWYWVHTGRLSEGRRWLNRAAPGVARTGDTKVWARALYGAGLLARIQGEQADAAPLLKESVRRWRRLGPQGRKGLAHALAAQGIVARAHGDLATARSCLEQAVTLCREAGDPWGLAHALSWFSLALRDHEAYDLATLAAAESVARWRKLGDPWGLGLALGHSAMVSLRQCDYQTAYARYAEALAVYSAAGDQRGIAQSLHDLGLALLNLGDEVQARHFIEDSLARFQAVGHPFGIALNTVYMGHLELRAGDDKLAESYYRQALDLSRTVGPRSFRCNCLRGLAGLAAVRRQARRAARLWGVVVANVAAAGTYFDNEACIFYGRTISAAQAQIGEAAFEVASAEGGALSWDEAVAYALSSDDVS